MNKSMKVLGAAAVLAVAIPLGAYAAAGSPGGLDSKADSIKTEQKQAAIDAGEGAVIKKGSEANPFGYDIKNLLDLFGMDKERFGQAVKNGKTMAALAADSNVSRQQLLEVLGASIDKGYEIGVQNGKFTREQAETLKTNMKNSLDKSIDTPLSELLQIIKVPDPGYEMKQALDVLGMDKMSFGQALEAGKSLADIAAEKGVDRRQLVDAMKAGLDTALDDSVQHGKLTREDADKKKEAVLAGIDKTIDAKNTAKEKGKPLSK